MRKLLLVVALSASGAVSSSGPKPPARLLFTVKSRFMSDPVATADGRRIYYQDSTELFMFDRATGRSSRVLGNVTGANWSLAVSPAGDRLAFLRNAEGGTDNQLWCVSLDPRTGLAAGEPRRVTILSTGYATFAPDGKSIAFNSGTIRTKSKIVVVPANGGPERVVAETQGEVWPIMWAKPDSIYFGVSYNNDVTNTKSGIFRVGVAGGKPERVVRTAAWGNYPGLSPDGRLMIGYSPIWDSVFIATASGKRVATYSTGDGWDPDPWATPDVWATGTTALGLRQRSMRALRVVDLDGGKQRVVSDTGEIVAPLWSPDGRRVAVVQRQSSSILVVDLSTGARRLISTGPIPGIERSMWWSPDGRFIAYKTMARGISLLDVGSATVRRLALQGVDGPWLQWRGDSRAVIYGVKNPMWTPDSVMKVDIHEVTTDGRDRELQPSVVASCQGLALSSFCGKIIDDSLMATWYKGAYSVVNFRSGRTLRLVYSRGGSEQTQAPPVPTFSANGKWMAVRRHLTGDDSWSIEMMHPDGSAHRSVPLTFPISPGGNNPWISDDGSQVIVASGGCVSVPKHVCLDSLTLYRVNVVTGKSTELAAFPSKTHSYLNGMISRDGRSLALLDDVEQLVDVYEFDFSALTKVAVR